MLSKVILIGVMWAATVFGSACSATLEYIVTYEKGAPVLHVDAVATSLSGTSIDLIFRTEAAYVSEHVSNLESSVGRPVSRGEGRWLVRGVGKTLSYSYDIDRFVRWRPNVPWGTSDDIAVYFDDECGILMAPYFFIYPDGQEFSSIRVRFVVPEDWVVLVPYSDKGDHYEVQQVTTDLLQDFICRQNIYMGPMEFYSETSVDGCKIQFGKLVGDDFDSELTSRDDVDAYVEATAKSVVTLAEVFGANPYDKFVMYTNFKKLMDGTWLQGKGTRYLGNGYQYWPEHRWDELIGHLRAAWIHRWCAPLLAENTIAKGIFEDYYGHLLAWELFGDPSYPAKMYHYYLMYEWMCAHHDREPDSYTTREDEYDVYFRWEFIGLLLDQEIQKRSNGIYSLADAFCWLYARYANSGYTVTSFDLEQAIGSATGVWLTDVFSTYVYGDAQLPVYEYLADYKPYFEEYAPTFEKTRRRSDFLGHTIPFFVEIVLAASLSKHLPWGIGGEGLASGFAEYVLDRYEIDDLTEANVTEALTAITGENCSDFFTHWASSYGHLSIEDLRAWLRDYRELRAPGANRTIASAAFGSEELAIICDGLVGEDWAGVEPCCRDRIGDTLQPGADIQSVYVWADSEFLYARIDVADGAPAPERVMYSIYIQLPEWTTTSYALQNTSVGPALFVPNEGLRPVPMGIASVFEVAVPLEWIGDPQVVRLRAETRPMGGRWEDRYDDTGWWTISLRQ